MRQSAPITHLVFRALRDRSGVAAIEFAILAPVYLLMLVGMIGYGIYFGASHSVQQLAADAARASIAGLDEADRRRLAEGFIARNASSYFFIDPARLAVDLRPHPSDGDQFNVRIAYDASQLPIWNLFSGLAMPDQTIIRGSTIRIGGI
jgi:Flp pilus assembly protein TadG